MTKPTIPSSDSSELEAEELRIHQAIEDWRKWWQELRDLGKPDFGQMGDRLIRFRNDLAKHFLHEETSSPLIAMAREADESFQERVAALWREHTALLRELDSLIDQLKSCGPALGCWSDARDAFESFLDRLRAHEEVESRLFQRG
jgi:iron-sulfur cluster repair protein YtfE (RIC family)